MQDQTKDAPTQVPDGTQPLDQAFGFGHPAHKPDPTAAYGFQPEQSQSRVLPVRKDARWRVPG